MSAEGTYECKLGRADSRTERADKIASHSTRAAPTQVHSRRPPNITPSRARHPVSDMEIKAETKQKQQSFQNVKQASWELRRIHGRG
jgi:hypothetical protein